MVVSLQLPALDLENRVSAAMFGRRAMPRVKGAGGAVTLTNDDNCSSMSDAIAYMRAVIYALEHGGKVSKQAQAFGEKRLATIEASKASKVSDKAAE